MIQGQYEIAVQIWKEFSDVTWVEELVGPARHKRDQGSRATTEDESRAMDVRFID